MYDIQLVVTEKYVFKHRNVTKLISFRPSSVSLDTNAQK